MIEELSTVAEGVPTSAPAESVEVETTASQSRSPWDDLAVDETPEEQPAAPEAEPKTSETPAVESEKKEDEPAVTAAEKTPEDDVLEEIFAAEPEKETEPDIDKMTPEEAAKLQRNKAGQEYLKRAERVYQPLKAFKYDQLPVAELQTQLSEFLGSAKSTEFAQFAAHQLVDSNPEAAFQRAYALTMLRKDPNWNYATAKIPTLADLVAGQGQPAQTTAVTETPQTLSEMTKDLDAKFDFDWRDPANDEEFADEIELAMAKTMRAMESKAVSESTQNTELQTKLADLEKKVEELTAGTQSQGEKEFNTKLEETFGEYRSGIESKLLPYLLRNAGLEPSKEDIPEIAAFKAKKAALFEGTTQKESPFEVFAYNESTVKSQIEQVMTRIIRAQQAEVAARLKGNAADATKHRDAAQEESIPLMRLLGQAGKEFVEREIRPEIELFGKLSSQRVQPLKQASERKEVVSNGAGHGSIAPPASKARTTADVFNELAANVEREERLRANA